MKVLDVLLLLRSRLRDENYNELRFSNNELIDYLEQMQNKVISEFGLNLQEFVFDVGQVELELPSECLYFYLAKCGKNKIPLKTYQEYLENENELCIYARSLVKYCLSLKVGQKVKVYLALSCKLSDENDDLSIESVFVNYLVLKVMKNILLTETNLNNLQKIELYDALIKQERNDLIALLNRAREKRSFVTKYIKV